MDNLLAFEFSLVCTRSRYIINNVNECIVLTFVSLAISSPEAAILLVCAMNRDEPSTSPWSPCASRPLVKGTRALGTRLCHLELIWYYLFYPFIPSFSTRVLSQAGVSSCSTGHEDALCAPEWSQPNQLKTKLIDL